MPKDPEDYPGDSPPEGDSPEENSPRPDGSPDTPDSSDDQGELPFGGDSKDSAFESNFPKADFPKSDLDKSKGEGSESGEAEPESEEKELDEESRDDQVEDPATIEESSEAESGDDPHIAGELGPDHDDPYHDEYHHDHDDYHHEYHEEQEHQYDHDYHGHEDDHGDYGYGHGAGYGDDQGDSEEEGFGGPIKPFLDHLEDLRWTVMKVVVAIVVGMLIALIGSPYIVKFLTYPLNSAQQIQQVNSNPDKRMIPVKLGDGVAFHVRESDLKEWVEEGLLVKDANQTEVITALRLIPSPGSLDVNGTKYSMQLHVDTNGTDRVPWEVELKAYGPLKSFFIALKIGLYGGLTISMPFVIYFLAQFVLPALRINEKQWLFKLSSFGAGLFMLGVVFCYLIIMKVALWASVGFANMLGFGADEWQAEEYISFVCKFMVGMGLAFQMPVILLFLVRVGILDYKKLSEFRMYAVVVNLILAAVITPTGDPFTLSLVAVPLQLLYELSTLIAWFWHKKEAAEEEDEE